MKRGFQIWSQNLNRTIFAPLFGPKTIENWVLAVFARFRPCCRIVFFMAILQLKKHLLNTIVKPYNTD